MNENSTNENSANENSPKLFDLLYLLTIPQIGPGRIRRLFQVFGTVEEIKRAPVQKLSRVDGIDFKLAAQLKKGGDSREVERQINWIQKSSVKHVSIWDKSYPAVLKQIPDPPVILFYAGQIELDFRAAVAVVGTRTPSEYGKLVTAKLVQQLVQNGVLIISGLARGVDAIAHHSALENGGKTAAVLGCGLDRCYPSENRRIFDAIPGNGAIISEYFLGTGPDAANFPRRNRIISGLSRGTLVVEAGDRSGALITAMYALEHNREVFAIPGNINNPKSRGANKLIQQGAKLVQGVEDVLQEIEGLKTMMQPAEKPVPANLKPFEKKVLQTLSNEPIHIDKLVKVLEDTPGVILSALLTLELVGCARQLPGKMFVLA